MATSSQKKPRPKNYSPYSPETSTPKESQNLLTPSLRQKSSKEEEKVKEYEEYLEKLDLYQEFEKHKSIHERKQKELIIYL